MSMSKDKSPRHKIPHGVAEPAMKPPTKLDHSGPARTTAIAGTGVVRAVDVTNGKIKLTHEPIAAMGWPRMTLYFRLKDRSLAHQVKEGDKVEFSLEKLVSGYVISAFRKHESTQAK